MAIIASDIKFYLSGGAGNTDPNASLGGIISTTEITDDTLDNLFDNVSGAEHTAGDTEYRCFYVKNTNGTDTAYAVKLYIDTNTPAVDDTILIGLDLAGANATGDDIADESTAPSPAVTFVTAVDLANALSLGNLAAGVRYAIWVKRVVSAGSTAQANNSAILKISLDTA